MPPYTKLKITALKFISAVDRGAQGPIANAAILKREAPGVKFEAVCKVASVDPALGLVFGWALATTLDNGKTAHVDLQNDAIVGGDDLIRIAADYMEKSAASDVQHDNVADGKILFMLPLTADIKTALKIQSDVEGLAVGLKPSAETFKRFVSKELNAFSIYGEGERTVVTDTAKAAGKKRKKKPAMVAAPADNSGGGMTGMYKRVMKMSTLTSEADGHQHALCPDDPEHPWMMGSTLSTSYATSEGATEGHNHAWVFDPVTGKITIATSAGHTHTVDAVVPADALAAAAAEENDEMACPKCGCMCDCDARYCPKCGCSMNGCAPVCVEPAPCPVKDEPSGPIVVTTVVAARAPDSAAGNSTQPTITPTVKAKEQEMPTETEIAQEKTIASLRKMLAASFALTEPQRLHLIKQAPADVDAFLAMDVAGQTAVMKAAAEADPEVHKTADGLVIRKSDGPVALALAKQADVQAMIVKQQTEQLAKAAAAAEQATFEKRAGSELSHFAKGVTAGAALLRVIDSIPDEALRKDVHEGVKGMHFAMKSVGTPIGAGGEGDPAVKDAQTQLTELAKKHATDNKVSFAKAMDNVLSTSEGAALYEQISPSTPTLRVVQ